MPQQLKTGNRDKLYIGAIIVLLAVVAFLAMPTVNGVPDAAKVVKDIYEIRAGSSEIIKTEEVSGLYKVSVSVPDANGAATIQTVYVTKDGKYIINGGVVDAQIAKKALSNEKVFAQCLVDKQTVILGSSTDANSALQLQALGIGNFVSAVFYDCSANAQVCQQLNVTSVPTTRIGTQNYEGLQTAQFFAEKIGCALNATA